MSARSVQITLYNSTNFALAQTSNDLSSGEWDTGPVYSLNPNELGVIVGQNDSNGLLTGAVGSISFAIIGVDNGVPLVINEVTLFWDNPYAGSNSYSYSLANNTTPFTVGISGGKGDNSQVSFILLETNASSSWMQNSLDTIGDKTLNQICIPGSHDSGMSVSNDGTVGAGDCNTITQTLDINGQLNNGARYFDIRPIIGGGDYYTGHYGNIDVLGTQGARGESISDIITGVNTFTAENNELVILNLSHSYDTDTRNSDGNYPSFTTQQWQTLFDQLKDPSTGLKHLYLVNSFPDLTDVSIQTFITGQSCVLIIVDADEQSVVTPYQGMGFFPLSSLDPYNDYSDTNNLDTMMSDQITKMKTQRAADNYFLLSWTLTQNSTEAAGCLVDPTGITDSILDLAGLADSNLFQLIPNLSSTVFPNILYIDDFNNVIATSIAMYTNELS